MIHRPQGELIFQSHDDYGRIEVREHGGRRCLHLGSRTVQSAFYLHDPLALALSYTEAMLTFVLLQPSPARVLLLGLGGGSVAKFLLHHFPASRIDAVELRPAVIAVAEKYFGLAPDKRLHLHTGDAADFLLTDSAEDAPYDVILVDAYDGEGPADATSNEHFPALCARRLAAHGVVVSNLWSAQKEVLEAQLLSLSIVFSGHVARLHVPNRGNIIVLAGPAVAGLSKRGDLAHVARRLKHAWHIDMPGYLRRISMLHEPGWRNWLRQAGLGALSDGALKLVQRDIQ